ncbi:hypothetical protein [Streptomyces sp. NPDC050600]|uniref:hypothetical protein n=1 Tax=Streptomyces sp. NPDC050600 TaxID=3157213 RepID=UPI00343E2687
MNDDIYGELRGGRTVLRDACPEDSPRVGARQIAGTTSTLPWPLPGLVRTLSARTSPYARHEHPKRGNPR